MGRRYARKIENQGSVRGVGRKRAEQWTRKMRMRAKDPLQLLSAAWRTGELNERRSKTVGAATHHSSEYGKLSQPFDGAPLAKPDLRQQEACGSGSRSTPARLHEKRLGAGKVAAPLGDCCFDEQRLLVKRRRAGELAEALHRRGGGKLALPCRLTDLGHCCRKEHVRRVGGESLRKPRASFRELGSRRQPSHLGRKQERDEDRRSRLQRSGLSPARRQTDPG